MGIDEQQHLSEGRTSLTVTASALEFLVVPQSQGLVQDTGTKAFHVILPESSNDGGAPDPSQEELSEAIRDYVFEFFVHRFVEFDLKNHGVAATVSENSNTFGYSLSTWAGICPIEICTDHEEFRSMAMHLGNAGMIGTHNPIEYDIFIVYMDFDFYVERILPFLEIIASGNGWQESREDPDRIMAKMIHLFISNNCILKIPIQYASSTHPKSASHRVLTQAQKIAEIKQKAKLKTRKR